MAKIEVEKLKAQAHGRWLDIFQALCPGMFGHAIKNMGSHVTCPFHGGENDFRFVKRVAEAHRHRGNTEQVGVAHCSCGFYPDGLAVIRRATGWSFPEVLKKVDEYLNGNSSYRATAFVPVVIPRTTPEEDAAHDASITAKVLSLWSAGKPFDRTQVPYYHKRGIRSQTLGDVQDTRYLRSLGYYDSVAGKPVKIDSFPAILALMRDAEGHPVAVHRTWLSKSLEDKAPVKKAKKLTETLGVAGAAIRLYEAAGSEVLGLTEGIETAHAVRQLSTDNYWPELGKVPVWACFAERNVRSFIVPAELLHTLKKIVVFADNDENGIGLKAAMAFKERLASEHPEIEVVIKLPAVMGWDWLDVLVNL